MDAVEIGDFLTRARQTRELSIAEASRRTHIRPEIIEALEQGDFQRIRVSRLQLRGMLRNYLRLLKQEPEEILTWFDQLSRASIATKVGGEEAPYAGRLQENKGGNTRFYRYSRWFAICFFLLAFLLVSALLVVLFFRRGEENMNETPADLEPASIAATIETVEEVPTPGTAIAVSEVGTPTQLDLLAGENLMLKLSITQRGWLRILSDDVLIHEGLVRSGDEFDLTAESEVRLESGNAAGIFIQYAGEDYSDLGDRGQSIVLMFRRNEIEMEWGPGREEVRSETEISVAIETPSPISGQDVTNVVASQAETPDPQRDRSTQIITLPTHAPLPATTAPIDPAPSPTMVSPTAIVPPRTPMGLGS